MTATTEAPAGPHGGEAQEEAPAYDEHGFSEDDRVNLAAAQLTVLSVCQNAAERVLARGLPSAKEAVAEAERASAAALAETEPVRAKIAHLKGELAECERRLGEVQAASEDDSLTVRIGARSMRVALTEECEALRERVAITQRLGDPGEVAVIQADRKLAAAKLELADLEKAIAMPFLSGRGEKTEAHFAAMVRSGIWYEDPKSRATRDFLLRIAGPTGFGDYLQRQAIEAFCAGDPRLNGIGTQAQVLPDGTKVITLPDGRHVTMTGAATPGNLADAPGPAQVDSTPGAVVVAQIREATGWNGQPAQGSYGAPSQTPAITKQQQPAWRLPSPIADLYR